METSKADKLETSQRTFIDVFIVPQAAKPEFMERMKRSRDFIVTLPGFIEDTAYERIDEQGNLVCATIAVWTSEDAVNKARETVQAQYKKEGFNLQAMLQRLNITLKERGLYSTLTK